VLYAGFTALCESYTKPDETGVCSTDQLTKCLNDYLGRIIDGILSGGGDVFKFAGDAFLALWPCHKAQLTQVVPSVLQTSLNIQEKCTDYKTDKGVQLRLKIGLAAGVMDVFVIGGNESKQYALTGQAIDDVNVAQNLASAGGVVLSPAAQDACCDYSFHGRVIKHGYMQVTRMSPPVQPSDKESLLSSFRNQSSLSISQQTLYSSNSNQLLPNVKENQKTDDFTNLTLEEQESLKTYLPKAVMSKFDDGQSLDWLSEMRVVSVLFINVPGIDTKRDPGVAMEQLQLVFTVIHKNVTRLDGSVNKFFMFDKGCTFLAIFGLPGQKHENDPARALRAARQIFLHLEEREMSCKIGVTTGRAFCGVVGHAERHEFTVIGSSVNMAARLMMAFPGRVTCDELSMKRSGITSKLFKRIVPDKPLKGIKDVGFLYSYSTEIHHDHFFSSMDKTAAYNEAAQQAIDTLVGRKQEIEYFETELNKLTKYHEEAWRDPTCVIIEGFMGIGKTKLLKIFKVYCVNSKTFYWCHAFYLLALFII
jgi:adenylate cyclase 10